MIFYLLNLYMLCLRIGSKFNLSIYGRLVYTTRKKNRSFQNVRGHLYIDYHAPTSSLCSMLGLLGSRRCQVRTRSTTFPLRSSKKLITAMYDGLLYIPTDACNLILEFVMWYSLSSIPDTKFAERVMCERYIHLYEPTELELIITNRYILIEKPINIGND